MSEEIAKKAAGYKAAEYVMPNMVVGIGTGSTVHFFIEKLIERVKDGLLIKAVFSSEASKALAMQGGIYPIDNDLVGAIDLTIDGADEIDPSFHMIKGGGGALLREKILASNSKNMIVIVDESKCVKLLGKHKLPLEILPFCFEATINKVHALGFSGEMRMDENQNIYITDNGNFIYDIHLSSPIIDPKKMHRVLIEIPGVIETGLFYDYASKLIVGKPDGTTGEITL